jgi:hypothetical protein
MNHEEIKRRAANRLRRRAELPNNFSKLTPNEIKAIRSQYNIGGWRGEAYLKSLRPRGLLPAFGTKMAENLSQAVKGKLHFPMHTGIQQAWPVVVTSRNENKYTGSATAPGLTIGYLGTRNLTNNEKKMLKKKHTSYVIHRFLKRLRRPEERNAVNVNNGRTYKIVRNGPRGAWRLKNNSNKHNMKVVNNSGKGPITIKLTARN